MKRASDMTNTQQHNSIAWCKAYLIALGNNAPVSLIHHHDNIRAITTDSRLINSEHGLNCALLQPTPRQRRLF